MKRILFVARNIPLPGIRENDVIFQIAERLRSHADVRFAYPAEIVPPLLSGSRIGNAVRKLPSSLETRGFIVDVYRYLRLPTVRLSYSLLKSIAWLNRRRIARADKFDIVHAHYGLPDGYLALWIKQTYGTPYVVSVRQGDIRKMLSLPEHCMVGRMYRRVLAHADAVLTLNGSQQSVLRDRGLSTQLIPHGIPRRMLCGNVSVEPESSPIRIATVGRLVPGKNVDWCIRALAEYRGPRAVEYTVVGDGPELESLRRLAADLDLTGARFLGARPRDDVMSLLRQSDVFLLPSGSESFGLVYLEAMGNGCAVVGLAETGVWGLFEPEHDMLFARPAYEPFRDCAHRLIDSPDLRKTLRHNGHKRVHEEFTWEAVIPKYLQLYDSLTVGGIPDGAGEEAGGR